MKKKQKMNIERRTPNAAHRTSKAEILFFAFGIWLLAMNSARAQTAPGDSVPNPFQRGGIYDRPYILNLGGKTAIGGYADFNSDYIRADGVAEGFSFEQRRFNVFFYSGISEHVKLNAELEFEHGAEEIALETALVDVLFATPVNLRAGILLSPIGRFNIAHDSPRYNVIDRPLVSTQIIPATLSEAGAGLFGAFYLTAFDRLTYEIYAVNGLQDGVVLGEGAGTRIPAGKSEEAFAEDNNGSPAIVGRLGYNPRLGGEFGISHYNGRYNTHAAEGAALDEPRSLRLWAVDAEYRWQRLLLRGEAALATIDVPADHVDNDFLAEKQSGFYLEGNYTLWRRPMLGMREASLILFARYDDIDLNVGAFDKTGEDIGEVTRRATAGVAFRPTSETVLRLSYWRQWDYDAFNNLSHSMNVQLGVATYF